MIHLTVVIIKCYFNTNKYNNNGVNLNVSNGSVNVNSGVPVGDYVVYYQICEIVTLLINTATVTVPVKPEDAPFVVEADYMVLTYEFTDGQDLDTRTRVITPLVKQQLVNMLDGINVIHSH
jgi:hypothetical protein